MFVHMYIATCQDAFVLIRFGKNRRGNKICTQKHDQHGAECPGMLCPTDSCEEGTGKPLKYS